MEQQPKGTPSTDVLEVALLQEQLATAKALGDVARLTAEVEVARLTGQVEALQLAVKAALNSAKDMQVDRDDWRERHDAREAELRALRELHGVSWWQKLLGGPTAPALEAK